MSKKASGKHYTSKGLVGKAFGGLPDPRSEVEKWSDKFKAFKKGRNVWFTIENPDKTQTNKKQIRVNGKDLYGDWRAY